MCIEKKVINIGLLFHKYQGFVFQAKVAELCGFNRDKMEYIVIDDGMCWDSDGIWVVHHYKITNSAFDPYTKHKHPGDDNGEKISEKRVKLSY